MPYMALNTTLRKFHSKNNNNNNNNKVIFRPGELYELAGKNVNCLYLGDFHINIMYGFNLKQALKVVNFKMHISTGTVFIGTKSEQPNPAWPFSAHYRLLFNYKSTYQLY